MKKIILVAAFCLLLPLHAFAADARPKIAVLPFDSALPKNFDGLKDGMPDIVTACFTSDTRADIVDRDTLAAITEEQTMTTFDASKFRQIQGATHLLRGSLAPQDSGFVMTLMLYDLATTKLVASAESHGNAGDAAAVACKGVTALGEKVAGLQPQAGAEAKLDAKQAEASRLMIEGLGAYYNGAYEKAFPAFMKLIRKDPGDAAALYWLGKSYHAAGRDDSARIEFQKFLNRFPKDARAEEITVILALMKGDVRP